MSGCCGVVALSSADWQAAALYLSVVGRTPSWDAERAPGCPHLRLGLAGGNERRLDNPDLLAPPCVFNQPTAAAAAAGAESPPSVAGGLSAALLLAVLHPKLIVVRHGVGVVGGQGPRWCSSGLFYQSCPGAYGNRC